MRLAAYAGASTVLAGGIILRAFHERPNFYSATVYVAQSSACRMILLNLLLLTTYGIMRALQKLLYGPLRAIEREQLWDKAWYAVTETALAMTTFRDEVGPWFFIMFVSLLAGKVWGWLSEARVEALEQQPPANPRLFHIRLIISLALSEIFDFLMLRYCVTTVMEQPRPGMMVMFAFEFAVLAITSTSTTMKYLLSLQEKLIIGRQMKAKVEERRQEIRLAREEAQRQRESTADGEESAVTEQPAVDVIDENEIDVPGWQEKGRWVLFLDIFTDLLKLLVYMCFFTILLMFHGIPIHIIRDVFLTTRSFLKRIADFLKYRNATKDMNARYPDATADELARDGTCIICREEMRPWQQPGDQAGDAAANRRPNRMLVDERQRPKKLPCGHILHFGCLRSWLERQQVCPTCRSSVLAPNPTNHAQANPPAGGNHANPPAPHIPGQQPPAVQPGHQHGAALPHVPNRPAARPNVRRARTFNLGPWRLAFAAGDEQQVRDALQALRDDNQANAVPAQAGVHEVQHGMYGAAHPTRTVADAMSTILGSRQQQEPLHDQIRRIEEQFAREFNALALAEEQLAVVRGLQQELERLRNPAGGPAPSQTFGMGMQDQHNAHVPQMRLLQPYMRFPAPSGVSVNQQQVFSAAPQQVTLGPGHPDLPSGLTLPQGWSLLPLQRNSSQDPSHDSTQQHSIVATEPVLPQVVPVSMQNASPSHIPPIEGSSGFSTRSLNGSSSIQPASDATDASTSSDSRMIPSQPDSPSQHPLQVEGTDETDAEPTVPIPNWGNADLGATSSSSHPNGLSNSSSMAAEHADANGSLTDTKGKAKAVSVEDVQDEDEK